MSMHTEDYRAFADKAVAFFKAHPTAVMIVACVLVALFVGYRIGH